MKIGKYDGDPLIFREEVAKAKLEDGRTVELSMTIGGGALIGMVNDKDGKHVATYQISPHDFVNEILACEDGKAEFYVIETKKKEKEKAP